MLGWTVEFLGTGQCIPMYEDVTSALLNKYKNGLQGYKVREEGSYVEYRTPTVYLSPPFNGMACLVLSYRNGKKTVNRE